MDWKYDITMQGFFENNQNKKKIEIRRKKMHQSQKYILLDKNKWRRALTKMKEEKKVDRIALDTDKAIKKLHEMNVKRKLEARRK